jgi:hypothetical protein
MGNIGSDLTFELFAHSEDSTLNEGKIREFLKKYAKR